MGRPKSVTPVEAKKIPEANKALIIENMLYAKRIARKFYMSRTNLGFDKDDFESAALFGLCDAASRYNPESGKNFKTYIFFRVRGAMYDMLRSDGIYLRGTAEVVTKEESVEEVQEQKLPKQVSYTLARGMSDLRSYSSVIEQNGIKLHTNDEKEITDISYADQLNPEEHTLEVNRKDFIRAIVKSLKLHERKVIDFRYFQDIDARDTAKELEIGSRSRISRLHRQALENIKDTMQARQAECSYRMEERMVAYA